MKPITFNTLTHKAPRTCGTYNGGFVKVTKCLVCDRIAYCNEAHPYDPCQLCGNKVKEIGAAKWVPPVYKRRFFFFKTLVSRGYWAKPLDMKGE
jgi:hypothetical protein